RCHCSNLVNQKIPLANPKGPRPTLQLSGKNVTVYNSHFLIGLPIFAEHRTAKLVSPLHVKKCPWNCSCRATGDFSGFGQSTIPRLFALRSIAHFQKAAFT